MSPGEAAVQWPLDRVLLWLAANGFSHDWQETFKSLELQGADFLELGHGSNGRGNLGKMHQVVYPQLAKECAKSGTAWDQVHERDEGKRMRKLIRQIHDGGSYDAGAYSHKRRDSQQLSASVPSDAGSNLSPYVGHDAGPTASSTSAAESAPVQSSGLKPPTHGYNQRMSMQMRSVTLPVPLGKESPSLEVPPLEATGWMRSDFSRSVLSSLGGDHRRQSPSVSSDGGTFPATSSKLYEESPKSGSPAMQHASIAAQGLTSSSTGDLSVTCEHSRGNSSDSALGMGRGASASTNRYYDGRRQQDSARPSPQETRQWSSESSSTGSKEHGKSFLNIFKKKPKTIDTNHPSPEEQSLESPTSPLHVRQTGPPSPFTRSSFNASDVSLGERPSSAYMSDHEKGASRLRSAQRPKKWLFATMDGWNYRLVDVTDLESVETLRISICRSLGISDWTSVHIFTTSLGQIDHDEPLNDTALALCQRTKCDSLGSLKLFVRMKETHLGPKSSPRFAGLGLSIPPDKPAISPTAGPHQLQRKPLDEEALNRLSPVTHLRPSSPLLGSRQSTLKAPAAQTSPRNAPQRSSGGSLISTSTFDGGLEGDSGCTDLSARHEEHKREAERKQTTYRQVKFGSSQQAKKDSYGDTGYRREGVIDFDSPRISPYEDKKPDSLVPLRKPPSAPSESNTLTKVNSLSKKSFDRTRSQPTIPTHGLGAVLASVGRMTSAIGTPSPSVPVPLSAPNILSSGTAKDANIGLSKRNSPGKPLLTVPYEGQLPLTRSRKFY